jgi:hypothetical protein
MVSGWEQAAADGQIRQAADGTPQDQTTVRRVPGIVAGESVVDRRYSGRFEVELAFWILDPELDLRSGRRGRRRRVWFGLCHALDPEARIMKTIEIHPAMAEAVTNEIRRAILDGTLPPGSRIKQEALAAELHVSRAPVRQALIVLKRDGFVQTPSHRGTIVAPLDPGFISDIYDLR